MSDRIRNHPAIRITDNHGRRDTALYIATCSACDWTATADTRAVLAGQGQIHADLGELPTKLAEAIKGES